MTDCSQLDAVCPAPSWVARRAVETATTPQELMAALSLLDGEAVGKALRRGGASRWGASLARLIERDRSVLAQALDRGFVILASDPLREVVLGRHFALPTSHVRNRLEWDSAEVRAIRVAVGVALRVERGVTVLSAEVRVAGPNVLLRITLAPLSRVVASAIGRTLSGLCEEASRLQPASLPA